MIKTDIMETARAAGRAARKLALVDTPARNLALKHLAGALRQNRSLVLEANSRDQAAARAGGLADHMVDRLSLNEVGLNELTLALEQVMILPDPVGEISDSKTLDSGLEVSRLRIPLGLIAFICEARPGALVEAAALTIKSGNGLMVKCGKEMAQTAAAMKSVFAQALTAAGFDPAAVTVLPALDREELREMLTLSEIIDLVIPRGGEGLIRFVSENSRIPVLKHFKGVCHLYVDQGADLTEALALLINGKTQRPSTCNALECLLIHERVAGELIAALAGKLQEAGIAVRACAKTLPLFRRNGLDAEAAAPEDFGKEFGALILAVKAVKDMDEALDHIAAHGSRHTECVFAADIARVRRFLRQVDASVVLHNASTRLNDGGQLGLGAEIGISTSKLHAYGPMGIRELTTTKFVVLGSGQLRV